MNSKIARIIIIVFAVICINYAYSEGVRHGRESVEAMK